MDALARGLAWRRLFPPGQATPFQALSPEGQADARRAADVILHGHRAYLAEFHALTAGAQETFENRAWAQEALNAERRVRLYRDGVNATRSRLLRECPHWLADRSFWMGARQVFLECVFDDYDADLALSYFYSTMRLAFDESDVPVEYADDGLAEHSHVSSPSPIWQLHPAGPEKLRDSVEQVLRGCGFRAPFENMERDAALVAARIAEEWRRQHGSEPLRDLQTLRPVFFRDR